MSWSYRCGDVRADATLAHRRRVTRGFAVALGPVLALALGACGISAQSEPQPVEPPAPVAVATGSGLGTGVPMTIQVYLLHGDHLERVERMVGAGLGLVPVLAALSKPLDGSELSEGLRTALPVTVQALRGSVTPDGTARVFVPPGFDRVSLREQQYAMAQLVFTVTANSLADGVQLVSGSRVFSVPDARGELTARPVSRADYAAFAPVQ